MRNNNNNRFMGENVIERNTGEQNYYGFNLATTSQSAFMNDNIFAGRFYIDTAITAESANTFIQNLRWYTNYQMSKTAEARKPAFIHINTGGGEISQGWAIINAIRACPLETVGLVQGSCMSMGVPILLSCNVRLSYEYSELMIHQLAGWNYGKLLDMEASLERCKGMQKRLETFMLDNSDMDQEFLDEIREGKTDYFFFPEEAKELGIIDEVIGDIDEYNKKKYEEAIRAQMEGLDENGCDCTGKHAGSDDGVVITAEDDDIELEIEDDDIKLEVEGEETAMSKEEITAMRKRLKRQKKKLKDAKEKLASNPEDEETEERIEIIQEKIAEMEAALKLV